MPSIETLESSLERWVQGFDCIDYINSKIPKFANRADDLRNDFNDLTQLKTEIAGKSPFPVEWRLPQRPPQDPQDPAGCNLFDRFQLANASWLISRCPRADELYTFNNADCHSPAVQGVRLGECGGSIWGAEDRRKYSRLRRFSFQ